MNDLLLSRHRKVALACWSTLALLAGLLLRAESNTASNQVASGTPPCCKKELTATSPLPDKSLYQLESRWTDDTGSAMQLKSLRGRVQVVTMFFTSCAYACPILVHAMKRIEAALPENVRTNAGFVLVSIDSDRDTPAVLANYRKVHKLAANWILLRAAPDDVLELAALLGVKYKQDPRGQFAHSNVITLLDPDGQIVLQQAGLNQRVDDIVAAMDRLTTQ